MQRVIIVSKWPILFSMYYLYGNAGRNFKILFSESGFIAKIVEQLV